MPSVIKRLGKPLNFLYACLIVLAFMQFYALYYAANNIMLLFCMCLCAFYAMLYPSTKLIDKTNFAPMMFLLIWLLYSLLSYNWAVEQDSALEYSQIIFIDMGVFFVFSGFFRNQKWLKMTPYFFLIIFVMYLSTSVWEIVNLSHLPVSHYYGKLTFVPTGPFYNENNLAGFFLLPLPFIFFLPKLHRSQWLRILCGLLVLGMFVIITIQGARIAMMAAVLLGGVGFLFLTSRATKGYSLIVIGLLIFILMQTASPLASMGGKMLIKEISSVNTEKETARMSSLRIRKQLFVEILELTAQSKFMGVGAGNLETYMGMDRSQRTGGVTNAHNFVLELLGDFGILITAGFLYLYFGWIAGLYRRYKASSGKVRSLYLMYLSSLLLFIATSALPSSIKWNHLLWVYLAAVNAMSKLELGAFDKLQLKEIPDQSSISKLLEANS
ncbi:MAG: O-antigen ligase family protein [Candidatus Cloacimonetes bacterium]|nr:O-antigen ligase family protein [Candidatus Cloacimonadota bacterium]